MKMPKSKSVYTKEDKAVYGMAMAIRLRMDKVDINTIVEEELLVEIKELLGKLELIVDKLENSDKFSHNMLAFDVQQEMHSLEWQYSRGRAKISETRNRMERLRKEAASKLSYARELCDESKQSFDKGQIKFNNNNFERAKDDYKDAIGYYNSSRRIFGGLTRFSNDLPLYYSTAEMLEKLKPLLADICLPINELESENLCLISDAELLARASTINGSQIIDSEGPGQIFSKNCFVNQVGLVSYNRQSIPTNFTDEQAMNVCSKMSDNYARHVAAKYQQYIGKIQGGIYRYHLHCLANKTLDFYGGPVLTFLLGLRPLKFSNSSAYAINFRNPSSDISGVSIDFPVLTFTTLKGEKYTLAFHLVHNHPTHKFKKNVRIFKKGVQVGAIDKRGFILDVNGDLLKKLKSADSSLLTFCCFLADSNNPAFYSGVETGNCFMCERKLTDPISIRYGIGPVCLGKAIY